MVLVSVNQWVLTCTSLAVEKCVWGGGGGGGDVNQTCVV